MSCVSAVLTRAVLFDREGARNYMLELINRDRASLGLLPVVLDNTASEAAQLHSDEMSTIGYHGHWSLDGRKPDQRYSELGGRDAVSENVIGAVNGTKAISSKYSSTADTSTIPKIKLDSAEEAFFNEAPSNDGHRRNIVNPLHTAVGIGLTATPYNFCCVQEFIDHYGDYSDIPRNLDIGDRFTLKGRLLKGVHISAVELRWEEFPKPVSKEFINERQSYSIPGAENSVITYGVRSKVHPISVQLADGCEHFSVDIEINKRWKPGLYYLLVWADIDSRPGQVNISRRTFLLSQRIRG